MVYRVNLNWIFHHTSGKIDRKRLPDSVSMNERNNVELPITETEITLAKLWTQLLNAEKINRNDNFIALGGDSMAVIMLTIKIQENFNLHIKASEVYAHLTLKELAQFVNMEREREKHTEESLLPVSKEQIPLPPSLLSLWMQCTHSEEMKNIYNLPCLFECPAETRVELFEEALNRIVRCYDGFRISFPLGVENVPYIHVSHHRKFSLKVVEVNETELREYLKQDLNYSFNLEKYPLFRCTLYQVDGKRYICSLVMHHLISDGWSARLIQSILSKAGTGDLSVWDSPTESYTDYASEINQFVHTDMYQKRLDYWKNYLQSVTDLRLSIQKNKIGGNMDGTTLIKSIPIELNKKIYAFCRANSYTPFAFFSGVFLLLLSRVANQTDFMVGIPSFGREKGRYNRVIGYFVQTLPLRFKEVYLKMNFSDYIRSLYHSFIQSNENAVALKDIQETMRSSSHAGTEFPPLQTMFALEEKSFLYDYILPDKSHFNLSLIVLEDKNGSNACHWEYRHSCYTHDDIELLADSYQSLLTTVVESPYNELRTYPISTEAYRKQVIAENTISDAYHDDLPLFLDRFSKAVYTYAEHDAIIFGKKKLTYRELDQRSSEIASKIKTLDVAPQSRIAIHIQASIDCIAAIIGVLKADCCYVPLDVDLPENRKKVIQKDASCCMIIDYNASGVQLIPVPQKDETESENLNYAYLIYTSGTTGQPKGTPVTHHSLAYLIEVMKDSLNINSNSRFLQFANISFDASALEIFTTFSIGATFIIPSIEQKHNPVLLAEFLNEQRITCANIPPVLVPLLPRKEYPYLRTLIVGGESTSKPIVDYWSKKLRFINAYGPTENTVVTTQCIVEGDFEPNDIGTPLPGVSCYVLDECLNIVPPEMVGELYIGGLQLTDGYLNRPELNRVMFVENPYLSEKDKRCGVNLRLYKSGDLVKRLRNGHFIFIGRTDNQVKLRGFRIELSEIEVLIQQYPDVQNAFVEIKKDEGQEELVAFVQPTQNKQFDIVELLGYLRANLPNYMLPSKWATVKDFPLTTNGKIDRKNLPKPQVVVDGNFVAPLTTDESVVLEIAKDVLEIDSIGVETDLLNAGMTSMQVMEFVFRLAEKDYFEITITSVYKNRTIRKLLELKEGKLFFWANEYDPEKPLIVLLCGYPYFSPYYNNFIRYFQKDFSIFVFESYHEFFFKKEEISLDVLFDAYTHVLDDILKDKKLFAMTGYCFGSELAIAYANYLLTYKPASVFFLIY